MKVLFLGDVVGRSGVEVVKDNLQKVQKDIQIDFNILNETVKTVSMKELLDIFY